jgi:hypothetical protein
MDETKSELPIKEKTEPFYLSKYFSFTHFHKLLSECQVLIQQARFGYVDLQEKQFLAEQQILQNKIDALENLFFKLKDQLIKNCEPFMDVENQKLVDAEEKRIKAIEKMFDQAKPYKENLDQRTQLTLLELTQPFFNESLNELVDIQTKLKIPLNNMGFIFPKGDEFDIEAWEKRFQEGE